MNGLFEAVVNFALEREDLREHAIRVMKEALNRF
jgi:hypothetical protein